LLLGTSARGRAGGGSVDGWAGQRPNRFALVTRVLDREVEKFHHAPLQDDWAYLLLNGVWMKVRSAFGAPRTLLLVAAGVRPNGERQLLAFAWAHAPPRKSFVFAIGDIPTLHKLGPMGNVIALVDCAVAVTACLTERGCVNQESSSRPLPFHPCPSHSGSAASGRR
jgi:hypothetical protein